MKPNTVRLLVMIAWLIPFAANAATNKLEVLKVQTSAGVYSYGADINLSFVVTNRDYSSPGDASAPFTAEFYAKVNTYEPKTNDYFLGSSSCSSVPYQSAVTYHGTGRIPETIPAGQYYVGVIVRMSPLTNRYKYDETNLITVATNAPKPSDAAVTSVRATTGAYAPGASVGLQCVVANVGQGTCDWCRVDFYASQDTAVDAGDVALSPSATRGALAPGATAFVSATATLPADLAAGPYYIGAVVVSDGDASAANNSGYDPRRIAVTPANAALGGCVTDQATGAPVPGALVRWGKHTAATGADGRYLLSDVPSGTCCLTVTGAGYRTWEQSHTLAACATGVKDVALTRLAPPLITNVSATNPPSMATNTNCKLVDIWYDLTSCFATCKVWVAVSTNGGASYSLPAYHLHGDGFGQAVFPGNSKHIVWNAGLDWNQHVSDNMRVKVWADNGVTNCWGESDVFTLDTFDGERPVVTAVDTPFSDSQRHAMFLEGIGMTPQYRQLIDPQSSPTPLAVPFWAWIDWNGHNPGSVCLSTTGTKKQWPGAFIGSNLAAFVVFVDQCSTNDRFIVRATGSKGTPSLPKEANCEIIPAPPLLGPFLYAEETLSAEAREGALLSEGPLALLSKALADIITNPPMPTLSLSYGTENFEPNLFKAKKTRPPAGFPIFGGHEMNIDPAVALSGEIGSDGEGSFGVSLGETMSRKYGGSGRKKLGNTQKRQTNGRFGKAAAFEMSPSFEGEVLLKYEKDASEWDADGYIGMALSAKFTTAPTYFLYPVIMVPGYIKGEFTADIKGLFAIPSGVPFIGDEGALGPTFKLPGEVGLYVVLGAGLSDIVNVEGYLGGGPTFEFQGAPVTCQNLGIVLKGGARFQVHVFVADYSAETEPLNYTWWAIKDGQPVSQEMSAEARSAFQSKIKPLLNGTASDAFRLLPRAYASRPENYATFCAGRATARSPVSDMAPLGIIADGVFQANVYPNSEPALASAGTNTLLLWVYDNTSRSPVNRTQAQWSRRTADAWSAPAPVWDDATADFSPRLGLFTNGTALAAWQNERIALPDGAALTDLLQNAEIACGRFNGATWSCSNLTQNAYLDHDPLLSAAKNGTALLAWTANPGNSCVGSLTNRNTFIFTRWTGTAWAAPAVIAADIGMTLRTSLAYNGTEGIFLATVDADDDQMTPEDQEIYGSHYSNNVWGAWTRLTDNAVQDTRPQAVFDADGHLLVAWTQGSNFVTCSDFALSGATAISQAGGTSSAKDFRLIAGPAGQTTLLWEDVPEGGGGPSPLVVNYDTALRCWSQPVALATNSLFERSFSGAYSPTGSLLLAYNQVYTPLAENNAPVWSNQVVDLCFMEHILDADPAVLAEDVTLSSSPVPGQTTDVSVVVRNLGEMAVTNLTVAFYEGHPATNGYMIAEPLVLSHALAGGDSVTVTQRWAVPETGSPRTFCVVVDPYLLQPDRNRGNNIASGRVMDADAVIPAAWVLENGASQRIVKASVCNSGAIAITNAFEVTFRRGATNGPVLATVPISYLGIGATYEAAFVWDMGGGTYTSAFETVYAEADAANVVCEEYEDNNVRLVQVMTPLDSDGDGTPDGKELRSGSDPASKDSDGDGLTDTAEMTQYGSDPLKVDTDGDKVADGDEARAGTDPLDANDLFTITDLFIGGVTNRVTWTAKEGRTYTVFAATNLFGGWADAPDGSHAWEKHQQIAPSNGLLHYHHTLPGTNAVPWFYRIRTP